jgi:hypothetical protein
MTTTQAIDIESYSKKNLLISLQDDTQFNKWDSLLKKLGATRTNSDKTPGWIIPKTKISELEEIIEKHGSRKDKKKQTKTNNYVSTSSSSSSSTTSGKNEAKEIEKHKKEDEDDNEEEEEDEDDEDYSEEDSDTDDELIQKVLSRRLMSESSHKSITEEDVENSDYEDVVSSMRRFRHIYTELKTLRNRVSDLEQQVKSLCK